MAQIFTQGTATATDVLTGKTFNAGVLYGASGTIANNGAGGTVTPTTTSQTKAAGYYSSVITISGDANLVSSNIKSGVSIFGVTGSSSVVDTSTGTATAANILSGKIAFVGGASVTGTMTNRSSTTSTVSTLNDSTSAMDSTYVDSVTSNATGDQALNVVFRPPAGWYDGSTAKINLRLWGPHASVIKAGQAIGYGSGSPTYGTYTSDATAPAEYILNGYTAYVNGNKLTGNMPNYMGYAYVTANNAAQWGNGDLAAYIPTGYYPGNAGNGEVRVTVAQLQAAEPDLTAGNIMSGVSIFGVAGSASPGYSASGNANASSSYGTLYYSGGSTTSSRYITVSGLNFTPKAIMCWSTVQTDMVTTYFANSTSTPIEWSGNGLTSQQYQLAGSAYVTYGGFQMPVRQVNSGELCRWVAYG